MMSMSVVLFCFLVMTEFRLSQANCFRKEYSLKQREKCAVMEEIMVNFAIKTTTPDQAKCKETETVCVKSTIIGTTIRFRGTFPAAITSVNVGGTGATAQVPVVRVGDKQVFANPMVAIFPTTLEESNALKLTVTIKSPAIIPADPLILGTAGKNCDAAKLCYLISGQSISLWGTKGAITSVTVTGSESSKVVIPLIVGVATDKTPSPAVLAVGADGKIPSFADVVIPFEANVVAAVGGTLVAKTTCATTESCYEFIHNRNKATFTGVIPATAATIEIKGNSNDEFISYYFGHAAALMQSHMITFAMASVVLFASQI